MYFARFQNEEKKLATLFKRISTLGKLMWVMTDINLWLHNPSVMVDSYYVSQDRPGNAEITNNCKILSGLNNKIYFFPMRHVLISLSGTLLQIGLPGELGQ